MSESPLDANAPARRGYRRRNPKRKFGDGEENQDPGYVISHKRHREPPADYHSQPMDATEGEETQKEVVASQTEVILCYACCEIHVDSPCSGNQPMELGKGEEENLAPVQQTMQAADGEEKS